MAGQRTIGDLYPLAVDDGRKRGTNFALASLLMAGVFAALLYALAPQEARAYSYASPQSDPLIAGREAFLSAVNSGDWSAAQTAAAAFKPDLDLLEAGDDAFAGDPGIGAAFSDAIKDKNADAAKAALRRATIDQVDRRLSGAQKNIGTYQTASTLVVTAQAFYSAMAGDLPAETQKTISKEMQAALDAVGKPGVFGYGAKPADPAALKAAYTAIMGALRPPSSSADTGTSTAAPSPTDASAGAASSSDASTTNTSEGAQ
ncbi:MAG: hypothetical protein AAGB11_15025 [Pseudomonadota bacterium]